MTKACEKKKSGPMFVNSNPSLKLQRWKTLTALLTIKLSTSTNNIKVTLTEYFSHKIYHSKIKVKTKTTKVKITFKITLDMCT